MAVIKDLGSVCLRVGTRCGPMGSSPIGSHDPVATARGSDTAQNLLQSSVNETYINLPSR
jgi:hypothetical protein